MTKRNELSDRATELVATLSAEQAYQVGSVVGSLLKDGMPTGRAVASTVTIAEFIRRGQSAQKAVDALIATEQPHGSLER